MNIFLTSDDPRTCAQALDDKRLVKMVLETAQLLSTAVRGNGVNDPAIYSMTHVNHPCAVFARKTLGNFLWLVEHGAELAKEYEHRYLRKHDSEQVILNAFRYRDYIPGGSLAFDFNCSGYDTGDVYHDYRLCLARKWGSDRSPTWTARSVPSFYGIQVGNNHLLGDVGQRQSQES